MNKETLESLESISYYCYVGGLISLFIGIVIVLFTLMNQGIQYIQPGLFIIITGYAYVKISNRLSTITKAERKRIEEKEMK